MLLTGPIVRFLAAEDLLTSALATNILLAVLQGLQIHGQHEANQVAINLFDGCYFVQLLAITILLSGSFSQYH